MRRRIDITISNDNMLFLELLKSKYGVCASELIDQLITQARSGDIDEMDDTILIRYTGIAVVSRKCRKKK